MKKRSTDGEIKTKMQGKEKKHEIEKMKKIDKIEKQASEKAEKKVVVA